MLSKNKIKLIRSLQSKKGRETEKCFIAEGERIVKELIDSNADIIEIIALPQWIDDHKSFCKIYQILEVTEIELQSISSLQSPQQVLCIVSIPNRIVQINDLKDQLVLAL